MSSTSRSSHVSTPNSPACGTRETATGTCPCARHRRGRRRAAAPCFRRVGHRAADEHDVANDERRAGPAEVAHQRAQADVQIDAAPLAEVRVYPARGGVQRVKMFAALDENPRVLAVRPVSDAARAVARQRFPFKGLLDPDCAARAGVKRLDESDAVRAVEHAADHQWRRAEVAREAQLWIALQEAGIDCRAVPEQLQLRDVVAVDSIERRVLGAAGVAVVAAPLPGVGASLGRERHEQRGQRKDQDKRHSQAANMRRPPVWRWREFTPDGAVARGAVTRGRLER